MMELYKNEIGCGAKIVLEDGSEAFSVFGPEVWEASIPKAVGLILPDAPERAAASADEDVGHTAGSLAKMAKSVAMKWFSFYNNDFENFDLVWNTYSACNALWAALDGMVEMDDPATLVEPELAREIADELAALDKLVDPLEGIDQTLDAAIDRLEEMTKEACRFWKERRANGKDC